MSPTTEIKSVVKTAGLKEKNSKMQKGTSGERREFLIPLSQNDALYVAKILKRSLIGFIVARNAIGNQSGNRTVRTTKYTIVIQNGEKNILKK